MSHCGSQKINSLIASDYTIKNCPMNTSYLAGKAFFCKLDYSYAYHCVQTPDKRYLKKLTFKCALIIFAYKSLTEDLDRSLSEFESINLKFLDPIATSDPCYDLPIESWITTDIAEDLIWNSRSVLECLR